jgi:hypothetical protein
MARTSNVSPWDINLDWIPVEMESDATPLPAETFADIDENDVHKERRAEVMEILTPEVTEKTPSPLPTTTTNELPVTAALATSEPVG